MLYQKYGCNMQFGGDDQWSNMLGGTELIRRKLGKDAYAMTITLLLNSEGKKMGKTQKGAVWLDPNNPIEQIDEMDKWEGSQLNTAKEILAFELTKLVHDEEEAQKAQESARALFGSGTAAEMPTAKLSEADLKEGNIDILDLLVKSGLVSSRSEGRRAVEQGGVSMDGEKVTDFRATFAGEDFHGEGKVLKRGKKNFKRVIVE